MVIRAWWLASTVVGSWVVPCARRSRGWHTSFQAVVVYADRVLRAVITWSRRSLERLPGGVISAGQSA